MDESAFLTIGRVIKAHGNKGELGVKSYADSPLLFGQLSRIYIKREYRFPEKYFIDNYRITDKYLLLQLEGIFNREEAKELLGLDIWIRKRDLLPKEGDEIYLYELQGCSVYLPENVYIGYIIEAGQEAAQELWSIQGVHGEEILFPAVQEFILEINTLEKKVTISPPPGLLDMNRSD